MGKVIMKSDKALENISRIKEIIGNISDELPLLTDKDEISRSQERLAFFKKTLEDNEKEYNTLLKNDSPYYEDGTLNNYAEKFKGLDVYKLDSIFAREVIYCIENDRFQNKMNAIKNIVKAYKMRDKEIMAEIMNSTINK